MEDPKLVSERILENINRVIIGKEYEIQLALIALLCRGHLLIEDVPGVAWKILGPVSEANIEVDMIVQNVAADNTTDFTFTVCRDDYQEAMDILGKVANDIHAREVTGDNRIAKLSMVGVGMRSHAGVASKMFEVLANKLINIQMISTSEIKISVVIAEEYIELATRALHSAFELED